MKETLYTIPLTDAFMADTECPFCYIERAVEQDLMDYVLGSGSSYIHSFAPPFSSISLEPIDFPRV